MNKHPKIFVQKEKIYKITDNTLTINSKLKQKHLKKNTW